MLASIGYLLVLININSECIHNWLNLELNVGWCIYFILCMHAYCTSLSAMNFSANTSRYDFTFKTHQPHAVGCLAIKREVFVGLDEVVVAADLDGSVTGAGHLDSDILATFIQLHRVLASLHILSWLYIQRGIHLAILL